MQSIVIAMLVQEDNAGATMLVRRGDGRFDFERVDARLAEASRLAEKWRRDDVRVQRPTNERDSAGIAAD